MNSSDWVLDTDGELPTVENYGQPQVFNHNVGEPIDPIFIGSTSRSYIHPQIQIEIRMGRRIVPLSLPQPAIIGLLNVF